MHAIHDDGRTAAREQRRSRAILAIRAPRQPNGATAAPWWTRIQ
jgi:hypothetical protein